MKICGVELNSNDAIICMLSLDRGQFKIEECRVRKLTLKKEHTREELRYFQSTFIKLMGDYSVDKIAIKERMTKGKFAGGAISFKLESAIQLIAELDVALFTPKQIKSALSENPLTIPFAETDLKAFQEAAFTVAYAAHMMK
jgi:hypothetical protein